ncbi:hypothetical protein LCGC14_2832620, partial [marine sediment metagenome]
SDHGPDFYGLARNTRRQTLTRGEAWTPPAHVGSGADAVTVFDPGFALHWRITR